jgi:hypothetical protein
MTHAFRLAVLLAAFALLACGAESSALTELIVHVESDLSVPDQIDRVTVSVEDARADAASADLTKAPLPRTLGLVHDGGRLGPFVLRVSAWHKTEKVVETRVSSSFQPGKSVHLSVQLPSSCVAVACASGETCRDGACMAVHTGSDASVNDDDASGAKSDAGMADTADANEAGVVDPAEGAICTIQQPAMGDTLQRGEAFNVQGSCRSGAGATITQGLVWTSDLDGIVARGSSVSASLSSLGTHAFSLCVVAANGSDKLGCKEVTIAVAAAAQPTASIVAVVQGSTTRSPYQSGEPLVLTGAGSGAGVTLSWNDSAQGALGTGPTVTLAAPSIGKHTVVLTITDRNGGTSTASSSFLVLAPGQATLLEPLNPHAALNAATDLAERSAGSVYVAAADGRLYTLSPAEDGAPEVALDKPPLSGVVQDVLFDAPSGHLYLATTSGLTACLYTEVTGPTACATYAAGQLPSGNVRAVLRIPQSPAPDRLLVGTDQGLMVADNAAVPSAGAVKVNERAIRALAGDRNVAWIATDQGLYRYGSAANTAARVNSGSSSNAPWNAVQLGSGGMVWLGGSTGLARYSSTSDTWTTWRAAEGLIGNGVSSIALESQQVDGMPHEIVWVGTSSGVSRLDVQLGTFQSFTTADGLPSNSVTKVLVMSNGTKLFATDAGIARYTGR